MFSILLSIGILLHLFRGELNFHPKGGLLQNARVALGGTEFRPGHIGVPAEPPLHQFPRTGLQAHRRHRVPGPGPHRVDHAVPRIRDRLSLFHLVRVNSRALFVMLVALGLVDWDRDVRHNPPS